MKTLVLGLGNSILCDDGVGIYVARKAKEVITDSNVTVEEAGIAGLGLLDLLSGYDRAIIIDAIITKDGKPGQIYRLNSSSFAITCHTASTHNVNFASALELAKKLDIPLPEKIVIFAIEAEDITTFSEQCTPSIQQAIPRCVKMIFREIHQKPRADKISLRAPNSSCKKESSTNNTSR